MQRDRRAFAQARNSAPEVANEPEIVVISRGIRRVVVGLQHKFVVFFGDRRAESTVRSFENDAAQQ